MKADSESEVIGALPLQMVKIRELWVRPAVLKCCSEDAYTFLEIIKDSKELLFMWVIPIDICQLEI